VCAIRIASRIRALLAGSGLVLFLLRLPFRLAKTGADAVTTAFYRVFLGAMGSGCQIEFGTRIESPRFVFLGRNVRIGKGTLMVSEIVGARLEVGDNVQINRSCHIDHTGSLTIGAKTLISEKVFIYSHSHGTDPRAAPIPIQKTIGENCWLGARCMVLENATMIADGTLIAAGSIVTKAVAENSQILAGVPARRIADR